MWLPALTLLATTAFAQNREDFRRDWCGDQNCYDVLNQLEEFPVNQQSKRKAIKAAWKALGLQYHPDKAPEDKKDEYSVKMSEINNAKDILYVVDSREKYDQYIKAKKDMDAPKEHWLTAAILMSLVSFIVVHMYNQQLYDKTRRAIVEDGAIKKKLDANKKSGKMSKRDKIKMRRSKTLTSGEDKPEDEAFEYTDVQISQAMIDTGAVYPGWDRDTNGVAVTSNAPTLPGSLIQTVKLPLNIAQLTFFNLRWLIQYGILRNDYSDSDCAYLVYTAHGWDAECWNDQPAQQKLDVLNTKTEKNSKEFKYKAYRSKSLLDSLRAQIAGPGKDEGKEE